MKSLLYLMIASSALLSSTVNMDHDSHQDLKKSIPPLSFQSGHGTLIDSSHFQMTTEDGSSYSMDYNSTRSNKSN
ncbi:hypothetical protein [Wandonia haliotis]|uniref:hypothetical protein n=1 Tax=Wandonia haliotis TaxID=574963 RepID=UPI0031D38BD6